MARLRCDYALSLWSVMALLGVSPALVAVPTGLSQRPVRSTVRHCLSVPYGVVCSA